MAQEFSQERKPVVWSIGHSDSGGGTGIQSDIQTFRDFNVYGCTVITAICAQNSFAAGYSMATERKAVVAQINALDSDLPAKAIKLGMMPDLEVLEPVAKYLADFDGTVVYDLELDTSAGWLLEHIELLKAQLLPRVDVLVVNTEEATSLAGRPIELMADLASVADTLLAAGARSVLITGAKFAGAVNGDNSDGSARRFDYWTDGSDAYWVDIDVVDSVHNRGGGSTLSAALTAALACGQPMADAIKVAKAYVTRGIRDADCVGSGPGSVAHHGQPADTDDWPTLSVEMPGL